MRLKDLQLKLKPFRLKRFMNGNDGKRKRSEAEFAKKKPSWMVPVTHGYHVAHGRFFRGESTGESNSDSDPDSVVVQREQIEEVELWFFGVFDARIGEGVTKYLQSHLFDKKPKESQLKKKSKEVMRRAYLGARASIRDAEKVAAEEGKTQKVGSVSALVIGGEKVVIASMGDYRAIVCRYGEAHQVGRKRHNQQGTKRHWATKLIPGVIRVPKARALAWDSGSGAATKPSKSLEVVVGHERIDYDTEFVILASTGIWEVMKHQEAVNLIRHMEDPQEAAECLAKEALTRMSRSNISCLVIRFES